jgi:mono/diheme cytochrome c family protein
MTPTRRIASISSLIFALVIAGAAAPANADSLSKLVDVTDGDRLAHTLCVNCHVVDTNGPVVRTDRVPSFSWIANQKGLTANTLPAWLSTAHERMPDFALTRDEIRKVSAYIMSLKTS